MTEKTPPLDNIDVLCQKIQKLIDNLQSLNDQEATTPDKDGMFLIPFTDGSARFCAENFISLVNAQIRQDWKALERLTTEMLEIIQERKRRDAAEMQEALSDDSHRLAQVLANYG